MTGRISATQDDSHGYRAKALSPDKLRNTTAPFC